MKKTAEVASIVQSRLPSRHLQRSGSHTANTSGIARSFSQRSKSNSAAMILQRGLRHKSSVGRGDSLMHSKTSEHGPALVWRDFDDIQAIHADSDGGGDFRQPADGFPAASKDTSLRGDPAVGDGSAHGEEKRQTPPSISRSPTSHSRSLQPLPFSRFSSVRFAAPPLMDAARLSTFCTSGSFDAAAGAGLVVLDPISPAGTSTLSAQQHHPHHQSQQNHSMIDAVGDSVSLGLNPFIRVSQQEPSAFRSQISQLDPSQIGPTRLISTEIISVTTSSVALYQVSVYFVSEIPRTLTDPARLVFLDLLLASDRFSSRLSSALSLKHYRAL